MPTAMSPIQFSAGIQQDRAHWRTMKVRRNRTDDHWNPVLTPGRGWVALYWVAGARGKPGINADIQNAAESVRMVTDPDLEVLGTNATSACVTFNAEGGIKLTTTTTSGDQVILAPHLDANQSAWTQWTWGTDRQTMWEGIVAMDTTITSMVVWLGLKLTNTSVVATDNDQVFLRYEAGVNSGAWQVISSIGGTDTTTNTVETVVASTAYRVTIKINANRTVEILLNDNLVYTTAALTDATDLIPYIGVQTATTAARIITAYSERIGRKAA
jgi:hypothetical protein